MIWSWIILNAGFCLSPACRATAFLLPFFISRRREGPLNYSTLLPNYWNYAPFFFSDLAWIRRIWFLKGSFSAELELLLQFLSNSSEALHMLVLWRNDSLYSLQSSSSTKCKHMHAATLITSKTSFVTSYTWSWLQSTLNCGFSKTQNGQGRCLELIIHVLGPTTSMGLFCVSAQFDLV